MSAMSLAMTKRSLQTVYAELEFLLETGVIDQQKFDTIMSNLPTGDIPSLSKSMSNNSLYASPSPQPAAAVPAPAASPFPVPLPPRNNNNSSSNNSEKQQLANDPTPVYNPPPPAYNQAQNNNSGPPVLSVATALYDYAGTDKGDLPLVAGETINVTEYVNGDWWKGTNPKTGASGIFPRSYVKESEKGKEGSGYGNMPLEVASGSGQPSQPGAGTGAAGKGGEMGKKFGKKLGNAAIFGAGATIGSNIVNGIF